VLEIYPLLNVCVANQGTLQEISNYSRKTNKAVLLAADRNTLVGCSIVHKNY